MIILQKHAYCKANYFKSDTLTPSSTINEVLTFNLLHTCLKHMASTLSVNHLYVT